MFTRILATIAAAGFGALFSDGAFAQAYPDKPVKVIVAYAPGGGADIVARIMSQKLSERLKQQFVVINQPGASGAIGTVNAANADPDGYTIFLGQTAEMSILPNVASNLRYDPIKNFSPIAQLTSYGYVIAVNPAMQANALKELVDYAKSHPKEINYGTPGVGSSAHLAVELFARQAEVQFTHIPYRGSGPATQAAVAGQIQLVFGDAASTTPLAESGQLRPLAVTTAKRSPKLPNVPTTKEAGMAYEVAAWHGFFAPTGTPKEVIDKLSATIMDILAEPALRQRFENDGIELVGSRPDEFAVHVRTEIARWHKVAHDANIKTD